MNVQLFVLRRLSEMNLDGDRQCFGNRSELDRNAVQLAHMAWGALRDQSRCILSLREVARGTNEHWLHTLLPLLHRVSIVLQFRPRGEYCYHRLHRLRSRSDEK